MKKIATLIIITSVFFIGCVTTGDNNNQQNEDMDEAAWYETADNADFILNESSVYVQKHGDNGGNLILELKSDFSNDGDAYSYTAEFFNPHDNVKSIELELTIIKDDGSEKSMIQNQELINGKANFNVSGESGVQSVVITGVTITFMSGNNVEALVEVSENSLFEESTKEGNAHITKGIEPLNTWLRKGTELLLIIKDDSLSVMNADTYEQQIISYIQAEWIDRQPENGFKLVLDFSDETEGLMENIEIVNIQFNEERDINSGGITGFSISPDSNMQKIFEEPQSEIRYQVSGWVIRDAVVRFSGSEVRNLAIQGQEPLYGPGAIRPNGDFSNPFTLINTEVQPSSWVSDYRLSEIVFEDGIYKAINKETGEEVLLCRIDERWESSGDGESGQYLFTVSDLSNGLILGGSSGGVFRSGDINGKRANVYRFSFRLDGRNVETQGVYQYSSEIAPVASFTLQRGVDASILSNSETAIRNRDEYRDTISFSDGNVLSVKTIE